MKKKYIPAEIELFTIGTHDLIATSLEEPVPNPDEPTENDPNSEGIGGTNSNPGGWII